MKTPTIAAERAPGAGAHDMAVEPSAWVLKWSHLMPAGGAVLDVAAGHGRHARWFAQRGHPVRALERDPAALASLGALPGVVAQAADLEGAPWPLADDACFSAVVVTNYLHRPLLPRLVAAVAPGGVLLYETFAQGNQTVGKPSNPAFLLAPGELLDAVRGQLRVVAFEDGFVTAPRDAFVQRICALRERAASQEGAGFPRYGLAG
ncbi:class I SAM-dependent methyltransferase [Burkholderia thailandensis]|nr:class I SAM-dependent methyltransferase [Burkholderia thailandensis]AOJ45743.1 SAM-dependent methyltransferase [Burkholderia thailandensis]AVR11177.1 SAM-dependent methyltransferase [Burkholderia thailandensis]AWY59238.1 SAM-dependent methyltransferase [Burkholderia thailandensis]AWY66589.1 SAM-dependent methyltransferase [Burkholderia thailandensis]KVG13928.1 SAM-dependent methyltransferase [Burkholderia thailandensis]